MAKLSRKEKYKELRAEIEKDMMETQVDTQAQRVKLSRVNKDKPTHAKSNLHAHLDENYNQVLSPYGTTSSAVMDDILGEVKQYNIDNGHRISDDTQINILNTLDTHSYSPRNQHIMPMEEDEDSLGSTMEMPKTSSVTNMDIDGVATYLPNQKLNRVNPVTLSNYEDFTEEPDIDDFKIGFDDQPVVKVQASAPKKDKLVLTNDDIGNTLGATMQSIDLFNADNVVEEDEFEETEEKPVEKKKEKKRKKKIKKERSVKKELPSSRERMVAGDVENKEEKKQKNTSNLVLNIILGVLVVALIASIGFTIYFISKMGM